MGQGTALQYAYHSESGFPNFTLFTADSPAQPVPQIFFSTNASFSPDGYAVSKSIAAFAGGSRLDVVRLSDGTKFEHAWTSAAAWINSAAMFAWNDAVFFDLDELVSPTVLTATSWAWDPVNGARPVIPLTGQGPGQIGSVCGLATDGNVFVWTQSSGWNGTSWDAIDIMTAPYTTDLSTLVPKKLRAAPGGTGRCQRWRVQGGFAGTVEQASKDPKANDYHTYLVRLSDGVMWEIPTRPGRLFGIPAYITKDEVALEEGISIGSDAGVSNFESWSIVRYPISLLGPGIPP
jgi:hypothetical protein